MNDFDLQNYFRELDNAPDAETQRQIRQRKLDYIASLSDEARQAFHLQYEQFMKAEAERFRRMADQAEEMFGVNRTA